MVDQFNGILNFARLRSSRREEKYETQTVLLSFFRRDSSSRVPILLKRNEWNPMGCATRRVANTITPPPSKPARFWSKPGPHVLQNSAPHVLQNSAPPLTGYSTNKIHLIKGYISLHSCQILSLSETGFIVSAHRLTNITLWLNLIATTL